MSTGHFDIERLKDAFSKDFNSTEFMDEFRNPLYYYLQYYQ